jgi:hypothetical protein
MDLQTSSMIKVHINISSENKGQVWLLHTYMCLWLYNNSMIKLQLPLDIVSYLTVDLDRKSAIPFYKLHNDKNRTPNATIFSQDKEVTFCTNSGLDRRPMHL